MKPVLKKMLAAATLLMSAAAAQAGVVATNSDYALVDGAIVPRILSVSTHGTVLDLDLSIEFSKCDDPPIGPTGTRCIGMGASFDNEISFRLTSPTGVTVNLVARGTYSSQAPGAGRIVVMFDDEAAQQVGGPARAGSFRPVDALSAFDGIDMFGDWTLQLQDSGRLDPLEYFSSSLDIDISGGGQVPSPVPEPASLAILGLGLLGIGAVRRRRA